MRSLLQDLRQGLRSLAAKPGFTLAAILTLALGIGVNTAIFSVIKAVVFDPLPYPHAEQLVSLAQANTEYERLPINVGYPTFVDWQQQLHSFASVAVFADWQASITTPGDAQMLTGMRVSPQYFDVFGVKPILGRTFTEAEDQSGLRDVVVLGARVWRDQYGSDPNIVGRKVTVNGRDRAVVGVLPESFRAAFYGNVAMVPEIWLPLGYRLGDPPACRDCLHLQAVARLKPDANLGAARAELDALAARLISDYPQAYPPKMRFIAKPLQATLVGATPTMLWLLFAAAGLVLLIACVDVGNLILVRAQSRERELAVRRALGAGRSRVARLLLCESALLAVCGGALAIVVALAATRALVRYASESLPRIDGMALGSGALLFALALSTAVALLTGLWPALRASAFELDVALRSGARSSGDTRAARAQGILIVAQIVLAFVLAIGATLVLRSFAGLLRVDPGFEAQELTAMNVSVVGKRYDDPGETTRFYEQLLEQVRAQPGVSAASVVTPLPLSGGFDRAGFHIKDRPIPAQQAPEVDRFFATPGYFATMRIPMLEGRDFSASDRADSGPVAIVSATLARTMWPDEDALGKQIQLGGRDETAPWASVVGVVGDVRQYGLDVAPTAQAYEPHAQQPAGTVALMIRSPLAAETLASAVRSAVRGIDAAAPVFEVAPMAQRIADSLARRRLTLTLFSLFALTALSLAAIGIYGVVSYAVAQQTQALGLRRALGASDARVWHWVLKRSAAYAALGMLIGIPFALAWGRMLASELVGISQYDPLSFAGASALLAGIVLVATIGPARRALRVAPTVALRYE
ncbi:MAG TPA: ABC transporter permease [Rhodanobacteraceae bacterium]|nr:ABC transporter permease [Rhodanobacteraceae bacterium]